MTEKLAIPAIHSNGTSRDGLLDPLREAHDAISAAIKALAKTSPHGRDYYVQPGDPTQTAIAQHRARLTKLHEVQEEIGKIWTATFEGGWRRD